MPTGEHFRGKKPTNTPKSPSDKSLVNKRIYIVKKMILQGYRSFEIVDFGINEWGLSKMQIFRYIKNANELISVSYEEDIEKTKKETMLLYYEIIQKGFMDGDMSIVLRTLSQRNKILGLDIPNKQNLFSREKVANIIEKGDKKVRERLTRSQSKTIDK